MIKQNNFKFMLAALGLSSCSVTVARADSYATYDVNGNYDGGAGTVTGTFTLDTTTNTSYAVDLTVVGVDGVNSGTITVAADFLTGTYNIGPGTTTDDTYDDQNPGLQVFLTYPAGGGQLYTDSFGYSSVGSFGNPDCMSEFCGYRLSGTVTSGAAAAAVPEPATWALMLGGLGLVGGVIRKRRRTERSFA